jgi:hypothetical protein
MTCFDPPSSSVSLLAASAVQFAPRMTSAQSSDVCPPLLLCSLQFFPQWDCDDCPALLFIFQLPPPLADPDPNLGDAASPEEPNFALPLSRGALNSSRTPSDISSAPPRSLLLPPSSSSLLSMGLLPQRCPHASVDPLPAALLM